MTIEFSNFSFQYQSQEKPTLNDINLTIAQGDKVVIIGPSGSGKSTLGQCLNGLIPHVIKGKSTGSLHLNGQDCHALPMHQYTQQVGTVLQDTDSQFVGLSVGEDIAFALENQLIDNQQMHRIVEQTAKVVELDTLLDHAPHDLSGGQKQRVSLAGILVDDADILLFDEPLASLDPKTGKATIEIIDKLHQDTNKTIIIIEHRLEDVLHCHVDRIVLMDQGRIIADTTPNELLHSPLLAQHGIREPLYLSALKAAQAHIGPSDNIAYLPQLPLTKHKQALQDWFNARPNAPEPTPAQPLLKIDNLTYSYDGEKKALEQISFAIHHGEFVSILGKNGSGKSTITKLIMGVIEPDDGAIYLDEQDLSNLSIFERSQHVGVVMQNPNHMISHHMIYDEVAFGLRNRGMAEDAVQQKVEHALQLCGLQKYRHWPIEALSYGQKKRVTIASILVLEPHLLILDEPTAGQDYRNYSSMLSFIQTLNKELGITVVIISHDMHLVLEYTTRSIVIADSRLIADAPMTDVFSQPALLNQANLATTSLYDLAKAVDIDDTNAFMQHFIQHEQTSA